MKPIILSVLSLSDAPDQDTLDDFMHLPAIKKIDVIANRINALMLKLIEKEPNSIYVVAWHEYGITAENSRYISPEDKAYLKKKMSQLALMYPNLVIVAGTVAEKKFIPERTKFHTRLEAIKTFYEEQEEAEIASLREEMELLSDEDVTPYQPPPDNEIGAELDKIETELENEQEYSPERCVIKNSAYIFANHNIHRHNKASPVKETFETKDEENWAEVDLDDEDDYVLPPQSVFQPFHKRNEKHIFKIEVEDGETFTLGIETCREHLRSKLKKHAKNIPIDLQLTLAYGGKIDPTNIVANNFVLIDYVVTSKLITSEKNPETNMDAYPVRLYKYSILYPKKALHGPYRSIYSEEKNILLRLTNLIHNVERDTDTTIPNRDTIYFALSKLKSTLLESIFAAQPIDSNVFKQHELECKQLISSDTPKAIFTEFNSVIDDIRQIEFIINSDEPVPTFNPKRPAAISIDQYEKDQDKRDSKKTKSQ